MGGSAPKSVKTDNVMPNNIKMPDFRRVSGSDLHGGSLVFPGGNGVPAGHSHDGQHVDRRVAAAGSDSYLQTQIHPGEGRLAGPDANMT